MKSKPVSRPTKGKDLHKKTLENSKVFRYYHKMNERMEVITLSCVFFGLKDETRYLISSPEYLIFKLGMNRNQERIKLNEKDRKTNTA